MPPTNEPLDAAGINIENVGDQDSDTKELAAKLQTYKRTLTEIYDLYDKKIEELSLIRRIGDSVRTPLELENLCRKIVEAVAHEVSVDRLALFLVDPENNLLLLRASYDLETEQSSYYPETTALKLAIDDNEAGQACKSGRPVLVADPNRDKDPLASGPGSPLSLLFLPLVARDKTVGLFTLSRPEAHPFSEDDVRIMTIISDQAAVALDNVRLFNALTAANFELRESERQARQTSVYLENLLEKANDVIFTLDSDGRVTYVNDKVKDWGQAKEKLIGRPLDELKADPESDLGFILQTPPNAGTISETAFLTGDGRRRDVLLSASRFDDEDGSPTFLVLARDLTERKQLEKQLFHSEKLASIGILAAGVAHEIGNPLSAISGYTQILQSGGADEDETREYLAAIESQTTRIQNIIRELLNYSRPSAGNRSEINLAETVPNILGMLTAQRAFRELEISYDLPEDPASVIMDRDHLAQIVINIAINAAQAMNGPGRLEVKVRKEKDQIILIMKDDGPGLNPEHRARIFDPFFTTKPTGQGTGLGLAVCHRIVESYNGAIEAGGEPGHGAVFTISLPAGPA